MMNLLNLVFCILTIVSSITSKPLLPVPLITSNIVPEPSIGIAHVPAQVGTAISKTVHYAEAPAITGYTSTLYKPDLSAFGPYQYNYQRTLYRPIKTLIPKIAQIDSDIVHVPVVPSIKDIELATPIFPQVPAVNHDLVHYAPIIANY